MIVNGIRRTGGAPVHLNVRDAIAKVNGYFARRSFPMQPAMRIVRTPRHVLYAILVSINLILNASLLSTSICDNKLASADMDNSRLSVTQHQFGVKWE